MTQQPHVIEIKITPEGKVVGTVTGVAGAACAPLSAWLDELGEVESDSQTPDYRRQPSQTVQVRK